MYERVYNTTRHGERIVAKKHYWEETPVHARLLCEEIGFHSSANPALLVFPVFEIEGGLTKQNLDLKTWEREGFKLRLDARMKPGNLATWVTYERQENGDLRPVTFEQFIREGYKGSKVRLLKWR